MTAARLRYEDIAIGAVYEFTRTLSGDDVERFAALTGDHNPLHVNEPFARQSRFGQRVVHGMFIASLFSTLVGMHCPGRDALYLSQTIQFRKPLFIGDAITVRGTVTAKSDAARLVTLRTEVFRHGEATVTGEASATVLE